MSTQTAGRSHGLVRAPLLALAVVAFAGFALDSLAVLGHPVPGWDVGIERAVQQVGWGPLAAVFAASDWFEGLKQVAAAVAALPEAERASLRSAVERHLQPLLRAGEVRTQMVSNIAVARKA